MITNNTKLSQLHLHNFTTFLFNLFFVVQKLLLQKDEQYKYRYTLVNANLPLLNPKKSAQLFVKYFELILFFFLFFMDNVKDKNYFTIFFL